MTTPNDIELIQYACGAVVRTKQVNVEECLYNCTPDKAHCIILYFFESLQSGPSVPVPNRLRYTRLAQLSS